MLAGGMYLPYYEKPELIFYFSANRSVAKDLFFTYLTKFGEAPIYILAALAFFAFKLRHSILVIVTGLLVMGVSFGLKSYFAVDRPFTFLTHQNLLDQVNLVPNVKLFTGASSFPSGHSMSAFAIYCLLILLLPKKKRYIFTALALAIGVAISRVYLVQHFFIDVYAGGVIGVCLAIFIYLFNQRLNFTENHFLEKPLFKAPGLRGRQLRPGP